MLASNNAWRSAGDMSSSWAAVTTFFWQLWILQLAGPRLGAASACRSLSPWVYQFGLGARGVVVEARSVQLSDESAAVEFEAFYDSEIDRQVRRAVLLLGSNDAANDVVHDAFIEVFKRWTELDDPGPYLHQTVLNRCRGVHRSRRRQRISARKLWGGGTDADDRSDSLDDVLAALPFNQRAAIVLRFYYGLTTSQIANELDCAPGSVGPWIDRGLKKMRKELT
jgi:DNA-directed RNA polymerase specialized sigma24 family protein